jgi:FAD/FMN-containing dehydrogenase
MNQILEFLPADRMVRVQAGVVTEQLQNYAEQQGMYYPVDFASQVLVKLVEISEPMQAVLKSSNTA